VAEIQVVVRHELSPNAAVAVMSTEKKFMPRMVDNVPPEAAPLNPCAWVRTGESNVKNSGNVPRLPPTSKMGLRFFADTRRLKGKLLHTICVTVDHDVLRQATGEFLLRERDGE